MNAEQLIETLDRAYYRALDFFTNASHFNDKNHRNTVKEIISEEFTEGIALVTMKRL